VREAVKWWVAVNAWPRGFLRGADDGWLCGDVRTHAVGRDRTDMPHPLGRTIERSDEQGRVWVTTPHIRQLQKLVREGHLAAAPAIHDSWTGKANESLTNPFYEATRDRTPHCSVRARLSACSRRRPRSGRTSRPWSPR
jgi:hypothetical protein